MKDIFDLEISNNKGAGNSKPAPLLLGKLYRGMCSLIHNLYYTLNIIDIF